MSYTYLQGREEVSSVDYCWGTDPCALLKSTNTTGGYCFSDNETEYYHDSPSGMTSAHSVEENGKAQLTLFAEDSHAKTSALQVSEVESLARSLGCGKSMSVFLKKYNRDSFLRRTPQGLSLPDWMSFWKILPRWGMMQRGHVLPLPQLVPRISESVALLWPTPASRGEKGTGGAVGLKGGSAAFRKLITLVGREQALGMGCGRLNPVWSEYYLLGWPMHWTDTTPLETGKFQEWLSWHGNY